MDNKQDTLLTEELQRRRFQTILDIHKSRDWWERQPFEVLDWIKTIIPDLKGILDVGCGDGRWVPAILKTYPEVNYMGIDLIKIHIDDCKKRWPKLTFVTRDIIGSETHSDAMSLWCGKFDLMIFGGVFNPIMDHYRQSQILYRAQILRPLYILITFDYASSGHPPWDFMDYYTEIDSHTISEKNQDVNQIVLAHLYKENVGIKIR